MQNAQNDAISRAPITAVTMSLSKALGIDPPEYATCSVQALDDFVKSASDGNGVDRLVIFNPDAIGEWIARKYSALLHNFMSSDLIVPMSSVVPPKTPVCFGSIYTGATPEQHGITHYNKITLTIDTFFDALVRADKRAAIVTVANQSMDILFRGRNIDYFPLKNDAAVLSKALQLIEQNDYDVIAIYNQEYDDIMHRTSPKSVLSKRALKHYNASYGKILDAVKLHYKNHNTLVGALTDHGVHRSPYLLGTHGKDIPKDMNILHFYSFFKKHA